jgi:hypothetical protein
MFFKIQSNPSENVSLKNIYSTRNDAVNALAELKRWGRTHGPCKIVGTEEPSNMFEIWQMRDDDWAHGYKFFDYKTANQLGYVAQDFYRCVYREEVDSDTKPGHTLLGNLFSRFNCQKPADYLAASMSVSDVIVFRNGAKTKAFYVEPFGFLEVAF